jgi:RimJ/RimL family protein N-acetyltransferase
MLTIPREPTQIELPDQLRGSRVLMRPYCADDAAAVFAAIDESREHLRPWVGWVDRYTSLQETRAYCERCATNWAARSDLPVGIFHAEHGTFLGGAGLHKPNWEQGTFEISCWLRATAAYRGYGTEALRLLGDLAFSRLDARLIKLLSDVRNGPTQRLAEKCGYVLKGTVREGYAAPDGKLVDLLVYALMPDDWRRLERGDHP